MRGSVRFYLLLAGLVLAGVKVLPSIATAQTSAVTTVLSVAPGSSAASQPVSLTATVSPASSTGEVTFYDGISILGVSAIAFGKATFSTSALLSGSHTLQARTVGTGNPASNVVAYNVTPVPSNNLTPAAASPFVVGSYPIGVVVGDFNGDGVPDVALADYGSEDVEILFGDGTGGFQKAIQIHLGSSPISLVAADFGNGHVDLAVATGSNIVEILIGDGHGGFAAPVSTALPPGGYPDSIVTADFNGDGKADLAVSRDQSYDVVVLLGDGTGGFVPSSQGPIAVGNGQNFAAVGDFNGDGYPDVAVINHDGSVTMLLNAADGSGKLTVLPSFATSLTPHVWASIVTADFDGDGRTDLAVASSFGLEIILGNGDGTFKAPQLQGVQLQGVPFSLATADFNGDGIPDLAIGTAGIPQVAIWYGDGKGGFKSLTIVPGALDGDCYGAAVGDFNNDGRPDVVFALHSSSSKVAVFLGSPLTITLQRTGAAGVGQSGTFQIEVQNATASNITRQVTVIDNFPAGMSPMAYSATGWTCNLSGQNVTCSRSDGLAGQTGYPPITVSVNVTGAACQTLTLSAPPSPTVLNVNDEVEVLLNDGAAGTATDQESTSLRGCLTISLTGGPLVATQPATYRATVTAAPGAIISDQQITAIVVASGLTSAQTTGQGWNCTNSGALATCGFMGAASSGQYPPIQISGMVDPGACPTVVTQDSVLAGGVVQDSHSSNLDLYGCVSVPTTFSFKPLPFENGFPPQPIRAYGVMSIDTHPIKVSASGYYMFISPNGAGDCIGNVLNPEDFCLISLGNNTCTDPASGFETITVDGGVGVNAVYQIPVLGSAQLSNFAINVNGGNTQLQAAQTYPVSMSLTPAVDPINCPQNVQPNLIFSFSLPSPDPNFPAYDVKWLDSAHTMLYGGTVAGTITVAAQVNSQNIAPLSGSGQILLTVPPSVAVIQSASIVSKSNSSLQIAVKAYSTPRETGPDAKTQVCLTFMAASGAKLNDGAQACALQQEIMLWYNEAGSYQYGSEFEGNITVSYGGDQSAIGSIQAIVKNVMGDSAPYCIDFKSGNQQPCQ